LKHRVEGSSSWINYGRMFRELQIKHKIAQANSGSRVANV
jgi:hypothetical protein